MATSDTDLVQLHRFFLTPDAKLLRDQVELRGDWLELDETGNLSVASRSIQIPTSKVW